MADDNPGTTTSDGKTACGHKPLVDGVASLFMSPKYSDYIIKCKGRQWPAHKAVMCPRSDFFEAICNGKFKEGKTGIIKLPDDNPHAVGEMLRYLYTSNFAETKHDSDGGEALSPALFCVQIHTLADKYGVQDLCELAVARFKTRAKEELKTAGFVLAIEELYVRTPFHKEALKSVATEIARSQATSLYQDEDGARFREMASRVPEFASQLAAALASPRPRKAVVIECLSLLCDRRLVMMEGSHRKTDRVFCPVCEDSYPVANWLTKERLDVVP